MSLNIFDKIYYINLSHRKDRKEKLEKQLEDLKVLPEKVVRIEAFHNLLNGHKGCAMSHILALKQARKEGLSNVLILEDDMMFIKDPGVVNIYVDTFFRNFKNSWEVFFLATNVFEYFPTTSPQFKRVTKSLCAHAYAVNSHYFEKLEYCFEMASQSMGNDELFMDAKYKAIDRSWHSLQEKDRWYIGVEPIGRQGRSYSDIEHEVRDRSHQDYLA